MTVYCVKDWDQLYETAETRKLENLRWVPMPNKHDGLGFRRLCAQRNKAELLAAWTLVVQVASKGRKGQRGVLARDGLPLDAEDMSLMTGFPAQIFEQAFAFFSDPKQGWLIAHSERETPADGASEAAKAVGSPPIPSQSPADMGQSPARPADVAGTPAELPAIAGKSPAEGKEGKEEKRKVGRAAEAAPASDSEWLDSLGANPAYVGIDVHREHGKMLVWCQLNKKQPTRRRFVNWLNRAERPMGQSTAPPKRQQSGLREPFGWKAHLNHEYPGSVYAAGGNNEAHEWHQLPPEVQAKLARELRQSA